MLRSFPKLRRLALSCPSERPGNGDDLVACSGLSPLVGTVEELCFRGSPLPSNLTSFTRLRQLSSSGWSVGLPELASAPPSLTRLEVSGCHISSDVDYLAPLTQLRVLRIGAPRVDARPLAALAALEELDLSETTVMDVAPLARLSALQRLAAPRACHLAGLSGLTTLTALRALSCTCLGGDVSFLSTFSLLQRLDLAYSWETSLRDVAAAAPFLAALSLKAVPAHPQDALAPLDVSFLPLLARLESFTLFSKANDASCGCIGQLPSLRSLVLTHMSAVTPAGILSFTSLTRLETLKLMQCQNALVDGTLVHLGRLSSLTSLMLDADGPWQDMQPTQPTPLDLSPLLQLRLRSLRLPFCDDAILRTVARLRSLRRLSLHNGTFADASMQALLQLTGLEQLFLSTTPVMKAPLRVTNVGIMAPTALPFLRRYTVAGKQHRLQFNSPYVWN